MTFLVKAGVLIIDQFHLFPVLDSELFHESVNCWFDYVIDLTLVNVKLKLYILEIYWSGLLLLGLI